MTEKYGFIDAERAAAQAAELPTVARMCALLEVSKSGFYEWRTGRSAPPNGAASCSPRRSVSCSRPSAAPTATGASTPNSSAPANGSGLSSFASSCVSMGLIPVQPRPFRTTTEPDPDAPDTVDLVKRDFSAQQPGTKVVGDITYIRTWQGWLYLASLIDCCTREVIGYAMADHMRTELVLDAVAMAMRNGRLQAGCIMHSDRGTQYTSSRIPGEIGRTRVAAFGRADRSMLG